MRASQAATVPVWRVSPPWLAQAMASSAWLRLQASAAPLSTSGRAWSALLDERGKRSEEHTSELQSLMSISYAVFCLTQKKKNTTTQSSRSVHIDTAPIIIEVSNKD